MNVLVFLSAETKAEVDFCFGFGNKCNDQNYKGKTKSTRFEILTGYWYTHE